MATRFQTIVVEYEKHSQLPDWLEQLANAVNAAAFRQDRFSFALNASKIEPCGSRCSRFAIVRGELPRVSEEDECAAVSAGGTGQNFYLSGPIRNYLGDLATQRPIPCQHPMRFVARFGGDRIMRCAPERPATFDRYASSSPVPKSSSTRLGCTGFTASECKFLRREELEILARPTTFARFRRSSRLWNRRVHLERGAGRIPIGHSNSRFTLATSRSGGNWHGADSILTSRCQARTCASGQR